MWMAEPDKSEPTSGLGRFFPAADLMTGKPEVDFPIADYGDVSQF